MLRDHPSPKTRRAFFDLPSRGWYDSLRSSISCQPFWLYSQSHPSQAIWNSGAGQTRLTAMKNARRQRDSLVTSLRSRRRIPVYSPHRSCRTHAGYTVQLFVLVPAHMRKFNNAIPGDPSAQQATGIRTAPASRDAQLPQPGAVSEARRTRPSRSCDAFGRRTRTPVRDAWLCVCCRVRVACVTASGKHGDSSLSRATVDQGQQRLS
jgi:hypothetical protein